MYILFGHEINVQQTVKPVYNGRPKKRKIGFQDQLSLNAGQKYGTKGKTHTFDLH